MAYTLRNMFEGIRPFDWLMLVIEAMVLVVIIYAEIAGWIRRRKERKRRFFIDAIVLELSKIIDSGKRLMSIVPYSSPMSEQTVGLWIGSVAAWTEEANKIISPHSSCASAAFMLVADSRNMDNLVSSHGHTFHLTGETWEVYQGLTLRLENLCRIVERPEAYF